MGRYFLYREKGNLSMPLMIQKSLSIIKAPNFSDTATIFNKKCITFDCSFSSSTKLGN